MVTWPGPTPPPVTDKTSWTLCIFCQCFGEPSHTDHWKKTFFKLPSWMSTLLKHSSPPGLNLIPRNREMADICWKGKLEMTLLPFVWLSSSASLAELFHHPVACVTQHDLRAISVQKFKAPYLSNWISQSWSSGFWVWTANLAKIWIFTHLAAFLLHLNLQSSIVLLDKLDIL